MRLDLRGLIAISPFLLAAACATGGSRGVDPDAPPIVLEVRNNNFQDATIFFTRDGERQRLGIVTGKTDQTFAIPWGPNLLLRLEANFIGGGYCSTRDFQMEPGQRFVLELQPDLRVNIDCRPPGR